MFFLPLKHPIHGPTRACSNNYLSTCFCNNTLQKCINNASEEKNVELNISTKQVCQQHVPNICRLGSIVEILLHSKESCRTRKFKIMRERTGGNNCWQMYQKIPQKISKKKNHIHRTMCYCKCNYIFQKRCLYQT